MNYFALYARIRRKATCSARNRICEMYSHADFLSYAGWDFGHADFADDADFRPVRSGMAQMDAVSFTFLLFYLYIKCLIT